MTDIEAFLLFLVYILPFGGIANIIFGITENDKLRIVLGIACLITTLFIMGYLLYRAKKESHLLTERAKKTKLLVGMFRHIAVGCVLMIMEFLVMRNFGISIRYILLIICISLVILTIIVTILKKF